MTAEIAVMNKWAVALAADSKVTISGMRASKTYDTVNKVFTLSKFHPVGIMIYGNAEFMQYPWETVIKLYRKQKGRAVENTITDWSADFIRYLTKFGIIRDEHRAKNIENICLSWFSQTDEVVSVRARSRGVPFGSPEYAELLEEYLREQTAELHKKGQWATAAEQKAIINKYRKVISRSIDTVYRGLERKELIEAAIEFVIPALFAAEFSPQSSGFVIAGFGEKEYFPTVAEYKTDGYVGRRLKISKPEIIEIMRDMGSCIRAFAQKEMVQRFMNGVDPRLYQIISVQFTQAILEQTFQTLDDYGTRANKTEKVRQEIVSGITKKVKEVLKGLGGRIKTGFSDPVVSMVALLPKDELAHLAESLVALTSLKRRVSSDAETVGGPIDVALISKGDGFVWIKRKHYFPAELNPQFTRIYLMGKTDEATDIPSRSVSRRRSNKARPAGRAATRGAKRAK